MFSKNEFHDDEKIGFKIEVIEQNSFVYRLGMLAVVAQYSDPSITH